MNDKELLALIKSPNASSDWHTVFACANHGIVPGAYEHTEYNLIGVPKKVLDAKCSEDVFTPDDVDRIVDFDEGENDGPSWVIVGVLKDGRVFFIEAGCDYTGWDCRASGVCFVADSIEAIHRWGLTDDARQRLKLVAVEAGR